MRQDRDKADKGRVEHEADLSQARDTHGYGDAEPAPQPAPPQPEDKLDTLLALADHMIAALRHLGQAMPQHSYLRLLADQMEERLRPHRAPLEQPAPVVMAQPAPGALPPGAPAPEGKPNG